MNIAKPMKLAACLFACACASFAQTAGDSNSEIKEQRLRFSSTAFNPGGKQPYAAVADGGKTLKLEITGIGPKQWPSLFRSKEGFFKPNTDYRLSFTYKVPKVGEGGRFLFRLYDLDGSGEVFRNVLAQTDEEKELSVRFRTPANSKRLVVMFMAAEGDVTAEIRDLKIESGAFETYIPATAKAEPFEGDLSELPPLGAKEFEVDLPRGDGSAISAEYLDVDPELAYLATRINSAIKSCRERGISKLILPKGRYYIEEDVDIRLRDLKDFEFDGGGSTLVYKRKKGNAISISGCERVKVSNLNFDWDWDTDPLASFVRVTGLKSSDKESYVDFTFIDYRDYPKKVIRIAALSSVDEATRSVGVEGGRSYMWETWPWNPEKEKKWTSSNVLRVYLTPGEAAEFRKGELFRMAHYYYDMNCFNMWGNKHLTLENINVYSTPGHAFSVDGPQQYWQFKNVNIVIPEGESKRAITCTADHLHIVRSLGYFKMENCDFSFGNDDCMNAHDNSDYVNKLDRKSVYLKKGKWRIGSYRAGQKIELRNADMSPTGYTGEVVDTAEITKRPGDYRITFKDPIPEDISEFVLFNRTYDTHNIIIRDCTFRQNRARGLLILARDVTVENCRFYRNEMGAVKLESGWTKGSWCEGYGVENVVVRNCEFDTVNPSGMENDGKARDIFMGAYTKTDPSPVSVSYPIIRNVLFENNRFTDTFGLVAFISSAKHVTFKDNVFINNTARNSEAYYRGGFFITHSSDINIINNTYVNSRYLKMPGVMYNRETCEDIFAEGNVIVKTDPAAIKAEIPVQENARQEKEYNIPDVPIFIPGM